MAESSGARCGFRTWGLSWWWVVESCFWSSSSGWWFAGASSAREFRVPHMLKNKRVQSPHSTFSSVVIQCSVYLVMWILWPPRTKLSVCSEQSYLVCDPISSWPEPMLHMIIGIWNTLVSFVTEGDASRLFLYILKYKLIWPHIWSVTMMTLHVCDHDA